MRGEAPGVAAIVLAAGSSVRMGRNKLLLELDGETVVQRAARTAIEAGLDPVVVVTGHAHEAVAAELHVLPCTTVVNTEHASGPHTSVATGIRALCEGRAPEDDCAAAIVMLADMPLVTADMLRTLVARYRESHAPLVISRYGDSVNAPPMLYDRSLFGELTRMDARCGRQVIRRHRHEAVEVEWPARASWDLDRPSDYERIREVLAAGGGAAARAALAPRAASTPIEVPARG